jgi:PAS domain S-box-containing protein
MPARPTYEELEKKIGILESELLDLRRREKRLRHERERLESLIEHGGQAMVALDDDHRVVSCNRDFEKLFLFSESEIVGKELDKLIAGAETRNEAVAYTAETRKGRAIHGTGERRRKDGTSVDVEIIGIPLIVQGKVTGAYGIYRDVSERKLAEKALKESEERYRKLVETMYDGLGAQDENGLFTYVNDRLCRILGYTKEQLLGRPVKEFLEEKSRQVLDEELNRRRMGKYNTYELTWKAGSGRGRVHTIISPNVIRDGEGRVKEFFATVTDVTYYKRTEEKLSESEGRYRGLYEESSRREHLYESLLNSTPDAVAIYNLQGEALYINPAFTGIFGFTLKEVMGKRIPFVPEDEREWTLSSIERVLKGEQVSGLETRRLTKGGEMLDISLSSSCYYDHEGKTSGIVVFLRDMSETRRTEKQLLHAQRMEAVGTLAGGIAHDFNNLLQAIRGYAQLLLMEKERGDPEFDRVREIERAAERASELTQQLLTFSRRVESKLRPVNLNQEVGQVRKLLERTIPKMINIELHLDDDLMIVDADPAQVEQVLMNLGVNARDAMPEGGELKIETKNVILDREYTRMHPELSPGDYVRLSFSDTGTGIEPKTLAHIFEPFYTTKTTGKGTGLGLSMVYGIVKNHGGHIVCHSEPGRGTIFRIYLPALKHGTGEEQQKAEEPMTGVGGTETILLVDDEESLRNLGEQILARFGYRVITAQDGESALSIYWERGQEISLVILDLIMPGMGGRQCLEEILRMDPDARVVIASGYAVNDTDSEVLDTLARGFIRKPYNVKRMLQKVREVLDGE